MEYVRTADRHAVYSRSFNLGTGTQPLGNQTVGDFAKARIRIASETTLVKEKDCFRVNPSREPLGLLETFHRKRKGRGNPRPYVLLWLVELNGIEPSRSPARGTRRAPLSGGPVCGPPVPPEVAGSIRPVLRDALRLSALPRRQVLVELNGIEASRSPARGTRRAPFSGGQSPPCPPGGRRFDPSSVGRIGDLAVIQRSC